MFSPLTHCRKTALKMFIEAIVLFAGISVMLLDHRVQDFLFRARQPSRQAAPVVARHPFQFSIPEKIEMTQLGMQPLPRPNISLSESP